MAFIDECDEVLREIVYQAERPHAFAASVEVAGVVLYAGTISHLLDEFKVIFHSLLQPLRLQMLADAPEIFALGRHVILYLTDGLYTSFLGGHEVSCRIYGYFIKLIYECPCQRVYDGDLLHFITEELYPYGVFSISYAYVYRVASHPECPSLEIGLRAAVQRIDQLIKQPGHAALFSPLHYDRLLVEVGRIAYSVQAGDAGYDYDVTSSGEQGRGCAETQLLYLIVDAQVLFYVGVCHRKICLRLIVVVIGNEILDGIVREE